ncbi:ABC transporter ATP-binding protein [Radicibacter daui]|uniref:ABC transporter ATP-binding protein n=1 Tax=Radicibacter daui TaxID=3064829 RepID=UPI004046F6DB
MPDLIAENLLLSFPGQGKEAPVLDLARLEVAAGTHLAITGPSGAGKSTLLYVLTGIEKPDGGSVRWGAEDLTAMPEAARDRWRRRHVGFVFQDFHLIPGLDALENVLLPLSFSNLSVSGEQRARGRDLLGRMGLTAAGTPASRLSRGEQQRVALARALIQSPAIIVADEPTASLDAASADKVMDLLMEAAGELGATLIAVTHDPMVQQRLGRELNLSHGRLMQAA